MSMQCLAGGVQTARAKSRALVLLCAWLSACAYQEKKAPCSADEALAFVKRPNVTAQDCGPMRVLNNDGDPFANLAAPSLIRPSSERK
jgi:hypothetical protein